MIETATPISDSPCDSLKLLRYLYKNSKTIADKVHILNTIGFVYLERNKPYPANLCFYESLLAEPTQSAIATLVQNVKSRVAGTEGGRFNQARYKVSVIVPTCGRPNELRQCLSSITGQEFKDFEIIVIDDAGIENSESVIASFARTNIKYKRLPTRSGPSVARNEGIRMSEGEYVTFLDDDDIYYSHHLSTLVAFLDQNPDYGAAYTNAFRVYGNIEQNSFKETSRKRYDLQPEGGFDKDRLLQANFISTLNIMLRRSCLSEVGLFNEQITKFEDWDLWLRLAMSHKFKQLNELTGEYRFKDNNVTVTENEEMKFWSLIIRNYYIYHCGEIALAKYYIVTNDQYQIDRSFSNLQNNYSTYFKNGLALDELMPYLNLLRNEAVKKDMTTDFLRWSLKNYILLCVRPSVLLTSKQLASHILTALFNRLIEKCHECLTPIKYKGSTKA